MKKITGILMMMTWMAYGLTGSLVMPSAQAAPAGAEVKFETHAQVVNINKAGADELQTLRGIGPAIAARILKYREEHGPFKKVEDLTQVVGIGDGKFQKMKDQLTL